MRKVLIEEQAPEDIVVLNEVVLNEVSHKWIYASVNKEGRICIATKDYDGSEYEMRILDISNDTSGFTYGNGYVAKETLQIAIKNFSISQDTTVYEFDDMLDFFKWATIQEEKRLKGGK